MYFRVFNKIFFNHKTSNINPTLDLVVYTLAVNSNNPELEEARNLNIPILSYPEILGVLSSDKYTIAISGTHGKTTTTAMVGHILKKAEFDPTIIVGSKMLSDSEKDGSNFLAGKSKYLVVEACEYKRSFLNLRPQILVITNVEADHFDYYKDIDDIKAAFREIANKVPKDGFIIANLNDENTKTSIEGLGTKVLDYSQVSLDVKLLVPGKHNILDAQTAIKVAEALGIPKEKAEEALKDFRGTWRRLEYKSKENAKEDGNVYYDDYAHHPTEIRASLSALRERYPDKTLVCVFEAHQQSRTRFLFDDFVESLKIADQVFVTPVFITREIDDGKTTNKLLASAVNQYTPASPVENQEELKTLLKKINSSKPLCIVFMGAGNIYKWVDSFL